MTLSSSLNRKDYNGDGVTTTPFSFPFYFLKDEDLYVALTDVATGVETPQTLNTHYTVSGAGDMGSGVVPPGGFITFMAAPAVGKRITILRQVVPLQPQDYISNDALPAETLEKGLDRLTMISQQLVETDNRTLLFPRGDTNAGALPGAVARASKFLGFDVNGAPVAIAGSIAGSPAMAPVINAATLAIGMALLASEGIFVAPTPLTTTKGISIFQSGPNVGPVTGPFMYNQIAVNNNCSPTGDNRTFGLYMQFNSGGANESGHVFTAMFNMNHNVASNADGDHIAVQAQCVSSVVDTGAGELYAHAGGCFAETGCTTPGITGISLDVGKAAGATIQRRDGVRIAAHRDSVAATAHDTAISVLNGGTAADASAWKVGLLFSTLYGQVPLQPTGDVIAFHGAQTVSDVLDLTNLTVTNDIIRHANFELTGAGVINTKGAFNFDMAIPEIVMRESDAAADTKFWDLYVNGGQMKLDILNDTFAGRTNFLTFSRTTNTPTLLEATTPIRALSGTAIPAGGTAGAGFRLSSVANFGVFFGSGVPTLAAAQGSLYLRSDGSSNITRAYINTNGATTWTPINTVA